jgi:hypothetical protein
MENKIAQFLYHLNRFTFVIQLLAVVSLCLLFYIFMMFGGGWDISTSGFSLDRETCTLLPVAFLLTFITDVSYPRLTKQRLARWLLLISAIIINAILTIQVIKLVYVILGFVLEFY